MKFKLVRSEPPHQYHVDLHWRLSNDDTFFTNVPESLFDDATETTISGQPILTMPTRQLVSYLAFHGGNHRWMRLSWLCDLAHAMRRIPQERWPDLLDEAARCNAERYLIGGLLLLERLQFVNELSDTISPVQRRRLSRPRHADGRGTIGGRRRAAPQRAGRRLLAIPILGDAFDRWRIVCFGSSAQSSVTFCMKGACGLT